MSGDRPRSRVVRVLWILLAAALVLGSTVYVVRRNGARVQPECRLNVPNSSIDPLVFPTKDGSAALDAAIMGDADPSTIRRLLHEQGGFSVPHGTACAELEVGPVYSRVMVTEGPFAGRTVWVPALHTRGS